MKRLLTILTLAIILGSCSPKLSPDSNWARKRWVLIEMKGVPVQLAGGGRDAHLEFIPAEKRFSGNGGCNHISGTYILEKRELKFGEVIATKMSCPDISFETTFLDVLKGVDRYKEDGNRMELRDGKKTVLVFQSR